MQGTRLPRDVIRRRVDIHVTGPQRFEKPDFFGIHINAHPPPAFLVQEKSVGEVDRMKGPHVDVDALLDLEEFVKPSCQPNILAKLTEGELKIPYLLAGKDRRIPIVEEVDSNADQQG